VTVTLFLVLALSVVIGLSLGVLGGGGSILTVPILVYVAGFEAKEAIAASLFVVGVTSAVSVISHARGGRVMWRTGLIFGAAGMAGAFVGGLLGGRIPGQVLLIAFALMMVATSVAMLRGRKKAGGADGAEPVKHELPLGRVLLDGAVVGLVTGLVGRRRRVPRRSRPGTAGRPADVRGRRNLTGGHRHEVLRRARRLPHHGAPGLGPDPGRHGSRDSGYPGGLQTGGPYPGNSPAESIRLVRPGDGHLCPDPTGAGGPALDHRRRCCCPGRDCCRNLLVFVNSCPLRKNDRNSAHRSGQHSPA
jgi:hypothetical protein